MKTSVYPVLMTHKLEAERTFFTSLFTFSETFTSDWYISLHSDGYELALIDATHDTIPEAFRKESQGVIINIEVDNVDELYSEIVDQHDVPLLLPIKSEDFGQRHFIIESPSGILVDVIQVIPPTAEFAEQYTDTSDQSDQSKE